MAEDCIFCAIVAGDIPGRVVHETDHAMAFLDANPLARGHTLVVPTTHHHRMRDLPADEAAGLFDAVHDLVPRVETAVGADGVTVGINDGEAAGQEVPHVHVHLVPRFHDDGAGALHSQHWERPDLSDEELDAVAESIQEV